jgi:ZIP family zinc transporter
MISNLATIGFSVVMGLAIFLSIPFVFSKRIDAKRLMLYNAFAIGILVFLMLDMFGDVAIIFGNDFITNPIEIIFILGFIAAFLFFVYTGGHRDPEDNPKKTSFIAALGIGMQNLTEGLVFGSAGAAGLGSIWLLSLIGFTAQNATEGFPIAAPLVGIKQKIDKKFLVGTFLVGGLPTILGTLIGLVFFSNQFIVFFDALASAAILYVVLVLFHVNIKKSTANAGKDADRMMWLTYIGILAGFTVAYVLNYLPV